MKSLNPLGTLGLAKLLPMPVDIMQRGAYSFVSPLLEQIWVGPT